MEQPTHSSINTRLPWSIILSLLVWVFGLAGPSRGEESYTVTHVLKAWKARQATVNTARFDFSEVMLHPKGTQTFGRAEGARGGKPKLLPEQDTTVDRRVQVLLARDGKLRYEVEGPGWVDSLGEFAPQRYVSTIDGKTNKTFYGRGRIGEGVHPLGFVNTQRISMDADNYHLLPFLLLLRPLDQTMGGLPEEGWVLAQAKASRDELSCLILERQNQGFKEEYWVDPKRQCIVMRVIRKHKGRDFFRFDCSYQHNAQHGWLPDSWEGTLFNQKQGISESVRGRMVTYDFDPPLSDENFQFTFPPGTEVTDHVKKQVYIPLEGGTVKVITKEDRLAGRNYVGVFAESSRFPSRRFVLFFVSVVVLLTLILVALCIRRLRRSKP